MNWLLRYRDNFLDNWYAIDSTLFYIVLCIVYVIIFLLKRMLIIDNIAAFEILQERGEMWVFDLFFGMQYLSVPIFLAWKFTFTAFLLWVGCFMFGYRVTFAQLWKMVMIFELVFVVAEVIKIIWLGMAGGDPSYQDYVAFYPLSLINLVDYESVDVNWHYPLKAINLFEFIYWGLLIAGIYWISGKKLVISVYAVLSSYGLFFMIWLAYYAIVYK